MSDRPSALAAVIGGLVALVVSIVFGTETYARELAKIDQDRVRDLLGRLATPTWRFSPFGPRPGLVAGYLFVVLFPIVIVLLILIVARRGNGFVVGWMAAVVSGWVVGFGRGIALSITTPDRFQFPGTDWVNAGFNFAGAGASYGALIGWLVGLAVMFVAWLGRSTSAAGAPLMGGYQDGDPSRVPVPPAERTWTPPPPADPSPPPAGADR